MRVIPVTTIPDADDFIFRAYTKSVCAEQKKEENDVKDTDEYKSKEKQWQQSVFPFVNAVLGTNINSIHDAHDVTKDLIANVYAGYGAGGLSQS